MCKNTFAEISITMKKIFPLVLLLAAFSFTKAQKKETPLLGICPVQAFEAEPYAQWYKPNYEYYQPGREIIDQIKKLDPSKFNLQIFFGTWCGDSKRELPRMIKILHAAGFPEKNIQLIGVYDSMAVYKQGPKHEEKGLNIFRVPTFVIYKKGKEVGRIVEYAVETLERDLYKIMSGQHYTPSYRAFQQLIAWSAQGLLSDENASARGLADELRGSVSGESELNSCGYVLLYRKDVKEAITVFRINVNLFPYSSNCFDSLGEAYVVAGMKDNARACYERAVQLDPENKNAIAELAKLNQENK